MTPRHLRATILSIRALDLSPATHEALRLLGASIRAARLHRRVTLDDLAERVGVSRPTMAKIERGDPGVAVGSFFEAATVLGVPLFHPDDATRRRYAAQKQAELALLPERARRAPRPADDDF